MALAALHDQAAALGPVAVSGPVTTDRPAGNLSATVVVPDEADNPLLTTVKVYALVLGDTNCVRPSFLVSDRLGSHCEAGGTPGMLGV